MFSIRVKELFEPIVLRRKADGVLLFYLQVFSWELETDLWVTLGDFVVRQGKLGRKICINLIVTVRQYTCHICGNRFWDSNFN